MQIQFSDRVHFPQRPLTVERNAEWTEPDVYLGEETIRQRRVLAQQKKTWEAFVEAVRRVTEGEHA